MSSHQRPLWVPFKDHWMVANCWYNKDNDRITNTQGELPYPTTALTTPYGSKYIWKEAKDFYAVLKFVKHKGPIFYWEDMTSKEPWVYCMSVWAVSELLAHVELQGTGVVDGKWGFTRRETRYSLRPILS